MTKVARLIAEEAVEERDREIVERMIVLLKADDSTIAKGTGLSIDEIKKIRKDLAESLQES